MDLYVCYKRVIEIIINRNECLYQDTEYILPKSLFIF